MIDKVSDPVIAFFDGLCEPRNPGGYACGGFAIMPHESNKLTMVVGGRCFGRGEDATNNGAEYQAALLALATIWRSGYRGPVTLRGDSQLVVRHFTGEYACKAERLVPLLARLKKAGECFESLTLEWVPRDANQEADLQSRIAYKAATGREPPARVKTRR
jgi:ribonuclease HI